MSTASWAAGLMSKHVPATLPVAQTTSPLVPAAGARCSLTSGRPVCELSDESEQGMSTGGRELGAGPPGLLVSSSQVLRVAV